ncbi:MAG: LuxR C-terminal-related transcriptional regulator [Bacteroidota bacterium]
MRKTILLYGGAMAAMIGLLKYFEYSFLVKDLSAEMYIGTIALIFTALGIWAGRRLTRPKVILTNPNFTFDPQRLEHLGISKREYEVLELIAQGISNREIAEKLFISLPTVKSHSSNLFLKLNVRRRTEALKKAKELMLLP